MTVIKAEDIGKRYRLPEKHQERYETFRGMLTNTAQNAVRRLTGKAVQTRNRDFWALRHLSFDIKAGERVGIVGRNGAGKSTLLKMLSRITEPTEGRISLSGRVGSLLEVGTGFHPELTGRENVYLNGSVLGMSHNEIRRKFDEIVAFAEIEQFLDMPVKRYSSGMYVRLAFAVAAHLEPDVLILDEVLAVGDAQFQKKCLGKMEDFAGHGRTILFVSHNMSAVQQLCNRVLWLDKGRLIEDTSDTGSVAHRYLFGEEEEGTNSFVSLEDAKPNSVLKLKSVSVGNESGVPQKGPFSAAEPIYVFIEVDIDDPQSDLKIGYSLYVEEGPRLYMSQSTDGAPDEWPVLKKGKAILRCQIPPHLLNEGLYRVEVLASVHAKQWLYGFNELPRASFRVLGALSDSPHWIDRREGMIGPILKWEKVG